MDDIIEAVKTYLAENIEDFDLKSELAWREMDRMRCPLPEPLASEIQYYADEWIEDYGEDYNITSDEFWEEYTEEDFI